MLQITTKMRPNIIQTVWSCNGILISELNLVMRKINN